MLIQVQGAVAHDDVMLAVDEGAIVFGEIPQTNLLAVDSWSSSATAGRLWSGPVGDDVALGARDQMMLLVQERMMTLALA